MAPQKKKIAKSGKLPKSGASTLKAGEGIRKAMDPKADLLEVKKGVQWLFKKMTFTESSKSSSSSNSDDIFKRELLEFAEELFRRQR
jgi:hypothetical protein